MTNEVQRREISDDDRRLDGHPDEETQDGRRFRAITDDRLQIAIVLALRLVKDDVRANPPANDQELDDLVTSSILSQIRTCGWKVAHNAESTGGRDKRATPFWAQGVKWAEDLVAGYGRAWLGSIDIGRDTPLWDAFRLCYGRGASATDEEIIAALFQGEDYGEGITFLYPQTDVEAFVEAAVTRFRDFKGR